MEKGFNPIEIEKEWYDWWQKSGFFKPRSDFEPWPKERIEKEGQFVICLPPPNVTGSLHIGHALTNAVQDSLTRWRRMKGENVLWIPGTDHAGIATQVIVERKLQREEGKSRHDIGREAFLEKIWEWKREKAGTIHDQLRRTASSLDWDREFFTMDEARAAAVTEAFTTLHDKGIIFRDTRLVHWCVALQSAISDLEVDHKEFSAEDDEIKRRINVPGYDKPIPVGLIYNFYYEVEGTGEKLEIATTRPETILGDTAVAVHPQDPRYAHLHGKRVKCPFREGSIPIVTDDITVDMAFGTGVVKITPAHDQNDFECGKRHKLPELIMMDKKGLISMDGPFKGQKRFDCRTNIIKALEEKGLYKGKKPHAMSIGCCQRSGDIIEKYLMPQWFMRCDDMAARALKEEQTNNLKLFPKRYSNTWNNWLSEIRPWCISRQLWWGHRIPAYQCSMKEGASENTIPNDDTKNWVSGRTEEEARQKAIKKYAIKPENEKFLEMERDDDVLDTWFSSGLLPHSALGWPNVEHPDFKQFFPTTLLETGHDILFFWVARMVMTSLEFLDKLPFEHVYLHAMVRDKIGRKMSKSLGNVIDPLDVTRGITLEELHKGLLSGNLPEKEVEKAKKTQTQMFPKGIPECGSDALRMGLLSHTSGGKDVCLDVKDIEENRFFCNKLWNAVRYAMQSLSEGYTPPTEADIEKLIGSPPLLNTEGAPFVAWSENPLVDATTKELKSRCSGSRPVTSNKEYGLPFACHWIISRLDYAICEVGQKWEAYGFSEVVHTLKNFLVNEFCSVFLEMTKPVLQSETPHPDATVYQHTLYLCLEYGFRLIHPLLPFVSEELWQMLPGERSAPSIMVAEYPTPIGWANAGIDNRMKDILAITRTVRQVKQAYQLKPKESDVTKRPNITLAAKKEFHELLTELKEIIKGVEYTGDITIADYDAPLPEGHVPNVATTSIKLFIEVKKYIDAKKEVARFDKQIKLLTNSLTSTEKKMSASTYTERVPANVREADAEKVKTLTIQIAETKSARDIIASWQ
eukprot:TRINITY_DN11182_c0_g1_i2.p1 TRINITY_DN11182_c0_g1~~TRINITY_DN11182_c0_g1_i2.p1  ORF type:complete len:1074 (+),score=283.03 TRINITY_DN11182_c0_g1_i2:137-3223(+)